MARPPKEDREAVKGAVLAVRLSQAERATLESLVRARADELARLAGQPIEVTAASYIRWLLLRDAEARGLAMPPAASGPRGVAKGATEPRPEPAPKAPTAARPPRETTPAGRKSAPPSVSNRSTARTARLWSPPLWGPAGGGSARFPR